MKKISIYNFQFLILFLIIFLAGMLLPLVSLATGLVPCGGPGRPECQPCHLLVLLKNIIDFFLVPTGINRGAPLVPLIATVMLVIGGAMFFLYTENPERVQQGRTIITVVIIGLIIIYGAWLIINLFFQAIGVQGWTGLGNWWQINCP